MKLPLEFAAIALAGLMALNSGVLLPIAIGIVLLLRGWQWHKARRFTRRTPIDSAALFLLLLMPLTQWVSIKPDATWVQVQRLVFGVLWFYAVLNYAQTIREITLLNHSLVILGVGLALAGPILINQRGGKLPFIPEAFYDWFAPIASRSMNANVFAGMMVILMPLALAQVWAAGRRRWLFGAAFGLMAVMLLISQSRGGLMSFVASLAVMVGLMGLARLHAYAPNWVRWAVITALLLVAGLGFSLWRVSPSAIVALLANSSFGGLEARLEIWQRALYIIQDFAYTGIGMGMFEPVSLALYPHYVTKFDIPHAHNLFLQVAVDLGVPGFLAWLFILIKTTQLAMQTFWASDSDAMQASRSLALGLLGSQCALLVHGLTDAVMWGVVRSAPLVWGVWALCVALNLAQNNTPRKI
ncbi:MAG: O-antigen ligase family protein [Anaerolineae bacterium]|nr:O-antigen ligase family protein [Anaerolineae bacterium]